MKFSIVPSKMADNTLLLSNFIKETLSNDECVYFDTAQKYIDNLNEDVIFVGFWTNRGSSDPAATTLLKNLRNKKIFLYGSCGFGRSKEYFDQTLNNVLENVDSSNTIVGKFICQGKMPMRVREKYENKLVEEPDNKTMKMMIENFDMALNHPNTDDLNSLKEELLKINN